MKGNRVFSPEDYKQYNDERKRLNKAFSTRDKTMKIRYKVLCMACEYNAQSGNKIIYNCLHCKIRYWNNCSVRQVRSGEIQRKLHEANPNLEWVMGYNSDGTLGYEWHRHEKKYEQDILGRWVPKE